MVYPRAENCLNTFGEYGEDDRMCKSEKERTRQRETGKEVKLCLLKTTNKINCIQIAYLSTFFFMYTDTHSVECTLYNVYCIKSVPIRERETNIHVFAQFLSSQRVPSEAFKMNIYKVWRREKNCEPETKVNT